VACFLNEKNFFELARKILKTVKLQPYIFLDLNRFVINVPLYWAVWKLGSSLADAARLPGMTGQWVGYAVRKGERIAKVNNR